MLKQVEELSIAQATESLEKDNTEILKEIYCIANDGMMHDPHKTSRSIARFSSLLINLARQAEESTKENIKMQKTITDLTKKLYFLTIALFFIALFQIILPFFQHPAEVKHLTKQEENNKQIQKVTNPETPTHTVPIGKK